MIQRGGKADEPVRAVGEATEVARTEILKKEDFPYKEIFLISYYQLEQYAIVYSSKSVLATVQYLKHFLNYFVIFSPLLIQVSKSI